MCRISRQRASEIGSAAADPRRAGRGIGGRRADPLGYVRIRDRRRPSLPFTRLSGLLRGVVLAVALTALSAEAMAESNCDSLPRTCARVAAGAPLLVVALGSSSTAGAGATMPERAYPAQLEAALARKLAARAPVRVVNKGVNGNDIHAMVDRIEVDVLALSPALVVWQVGSNDVIRDEPLPRFVAALRTGANRIRAAGIDLVLMDMQAAPAIDAKAQTPAYLEAIATVARETGAVLLPRYRMMKSLEGRGPPLVVDDGLHMTDAGYLALAGAAIGLLPLDR